MIKELNYRCGYCKKSFGEDEDKCLMHERTCKEKTENKFKKITRYHAVKCCNTCVLHSKHKSISGNNIVYKDVCTIDINRGGEVMDVKPYCICDNYLEDITFGVKDK